MCWIPLGVVFLQSGHIIRLLVLVVHKTFRGKVFGRSRFLLKVIFFTWTAARGKILWIIFRGLIFVLSSDVARARTVGRLQTISFFIVLAHNLLSLVLYVWYTMGFAQEGSGFSGLPERELWSTLFCGYMGWPFPYVLCGLFGRKKPAYFCRGKTFIFGAKIVFHTTYVW